LRDHRRRRRSDKSNPFNFIKHTHPRASLIYFATGGEETVRDGL
jgi:hypothetical protein